MRPNLLLRAAECSKGALKMKKMVPAGMAALLTLIIAATAAAQTAQLDWYVSVNGQRYGPYTVNMMKDMAQRGTLVRTSLVGTTLPLVKPRAKIELKWEVENEVYQA
jgi:hypothetical protein